MRGAVPGGRRNRVDMSRLNPTRRHPGNLGLASMIEPGPRQGAIARRRRTTTPHAAWSRGDAEAMIAESADAAALRGVLTAWPVPAPIVGRLSRPWFVEVSDRVPLRALTPNFEAMIAAGKQVSSELVARGSGARSAVAASRSPESTVRLWGGLRRAGHGREDATPTQLWNAAIEALRPTGHSPRTPIGL